MVTMADLDNTARKIKVLTETLRSQLFPGGKPDWMDPEQWAEIAGENEDET